MSKENKPLKIEFAPGCFDSFEGTQEELDELIANIQQMFESGELEERSVELDEESWDELPDEVKEDLIRYFSADEPENKRRLQ